MPRIIVGLMVRSATRHFVGWSFPSCQGPKWRKGTDGRNPPDGVMNWPGRPDGFPASWDANSPPRMEGAWRLCNSDTGTAGRGRILPRPR